MNCGNEVPQLRNSFPASCPLTYKLNLVISFLTASPPVHVEDKPTEVDYSTCASDHNLAHLFPQ